MVNFSRRNLEDELASDDWVEAYWPDTEAELTIELGQAPTEAQIEERLEETRNSIRRDVAEAIAEERGRYLEAVHEWDADRHNYAR